MCILSDLIKDITISAGEIEVPEVPKQRIFTSVYISY